MPSKKKPFHSAGLEPVKWKSPKGLDPTPQLGVVKSTQSDILRREARKRQLFGQIKHSEAISEEVYLHPFRILVGKEANKLFISYGLVFAGKGPGVQMLVPELAGNKIKSFFNEKVTSADSFVLEDCELYVRVDYRRNEAFQAVIEKTTSLEKKPDSAYYLIGRIVGGVPFQELRSDIFSFKQGSSSSSSVSSSSSSSGSSKGSSDSGSPGDPHNPDPPGSGSGTSGTSGGSSGSPTSASHSGKNAIFRVDNSFYAFCAEEADRFYLKFYSVVEVKELFVVRLPEKWTKCVQSHFVQSVVDYSGGEPVIQNLGDVYMFDVKETEKKRTVVVVFAGLANGSQESMEERTIDQWEKNQQFYKELQGGSDV